MFEFYFNFISEHRAEGIRRVVSKMMELVLNNVLYNKPFIQEVFKRDKPIYAALVPYEIWKGSYFERRFVTDFGKTWQHLAVVAAEEAHAVAKEEYLIEGTIYEGRLKRIQEVLNKLDHKTKGSPRISPDWKSELKYIMQGKGKPVPVSVQCDLYIEMHNGKKYSFEIKGPQPNSDQTKVSKEKIFKLLAMNEKPVEMAFFALAYNPFGKTKADYKWPFADKWFCMKDDPCVLIGNEMWDLIGGKGTYQDFVSEINKLGIEYKERIYREYLRMEPPEGYEEDNNGWHSSLL